MTNHLGFRVADLDTAEEHLFGNDQASYQDAVARFREMARRGCNARLYRDLGPEVDPDVYENPLLVCYSDPHDGDATEPPPFEGIP